MLEVVGAIHQYCTVDNSCSMAC